MPAEGNSSMSNNEVTRGLPEPQNSVQEIALMTAYLSGGFTCAPATSEAIGTFFRFLYRQARRNRQIMRLERDFARPALNTTACNSTTKGMT